MCTVALTVTGCSQKPAQNDETTQSTVRRIEEHRCISASDLLALTNGATLVGIHGELGKRLCHGFTIPVKGREYVVATVHTVEGAAFDLHFDEGRLVRIAAQYFPSSLREDYSYRGTIATRVLPWYADHNKMAGCTVVNANPVTREQIEERLQTYRRWARERQMRVAAEDEATRVGGEVFLSVLRSVGVREEDVLTRYARDLNENESLLERYDGLRVRLGMTENQVLALLGACARAYDRGDGLVMRLYGKRMRFEKPWTFRGLAILFEGGKVHGVYSQRFLNGDWWEGTNVFRPGRDGSEESGTRDDCD
jgi:hypothetical protein